MTVLYRFRSRFMMIVRRLGAAGLLFTAGMTSTAYADDILAYGEYLAGECTACHRLDGKDKGIPPIIGWDTTAFEAVLGSFRNGDRANKAMVSVAKALDDDQIKALAKYFGSLKPK